MARMLHITASPRGWNSASIRVGKALVDAYRKLHPDEGFEALDLFLHPPPEFNAPQAAAKYVVLSGQTPRDADALAWKPVIDAINHFKGFDRYVISSAMWNFSIPWRLKQYIDVLVQPALTFSYSADEGYKGLVTGAKAVLVLARGGTYGPGSPTETFDFQRSYLEAILRFIGITDIQAITIDGTLTPDGEGAIGRAIEQAKELATRI